MGIYLKSKDEIEKLRRANQASAIVLEACVQAAKPGASTWDLNQIAIAKLKEGGGKSAFLGYHGYSAVLRPRAWSKGDRTNTTGQDTKEHPATLVVETRGNEGALRHGCRY